MERRWFTQSAGNNTKHCESYFVPASPLYKAARVGGVMGKGARS